MKKSTIIFGLVIPIALLLASTSPNFHGAGALFICDLLAWGAWWVWLLILRRFAYAQANGDGNHRHMQCKDWMGPSCPDPSWHWAASLRGRRYPDGTTEWSHRNGGAPPQGSFRPGDSSGIGAMGGGL